MRMNETLLAQTDDRIATAIENFERRGYAVVAAQDRSALDDVRAALVTSASDGVVPDDPEAFMNRFHERGLRGAPLNDFRLKVYNDFNQRIDVGRLIWLAFRDVLVTLVGPDVAVQKRANLVIQPPDDIDNSPVHRDAPPNSLFEVVVWVPMVDCYGTKGMQVLDLHKTEQALSLLKDDHAGYDAFSRFSLEHGEFASVPYGSALIFWTRVVHAIPINREIETRWSLNLRYKNIFTPYGTKGFPDYFRLLELSPLTRAAIEQERPARLSGKP